METKQCNKCLQTKPVSEFFKRRKGLASICKPCSQDYQRAYRARPTYKNRRVILKQRLLEEMGIKSCAKCPESHLVCLDFHHPNDDKDEMIAVLIRNQVSFKRLLKEAKKCIVLCANCHRREHNPKVADIVCSTS